MSLLPIGVVSDLAQKPKFASTFDVVYFSNSMVHHFKPEITTAFKNTARVLVESAKFIIELKKEQVELFAEKVIPIFMRAFHPEVELNALQVNGMARAANCVAAPSAAIPNDSLLSFDYIRAK